MNRTSEPPLITLDVYSLLVDSRSGGTTEFAGIAAELGWAHDPRRLWDIWDATNKSLQSRHAPFASYRCLATEAVQLVMDSLKLGGQPPRVAERLLSSIARWPHFEDVPDALATLSERARLAFLSNIDDDLLTATNVGFEALEKVTSQQARAYKPRKDIYDFACSHLGSPIALHVAASSRDVAGGVAAGLRVAHVYRAGVAQPAASMSVWASVGSLAELADLISREGLQGHGAGGKEQGRH